MLRVRLLGPLRVEVDGCAIPPPAGANPRRLLAWLALHPGLHPRSRLAGTFWPDVLEESARGSLRRTLSELRGALGEGGARHLHADRERVGLTGEVEVDARAFEQLTAAGRDAEALGLCDGDLLADVGDDWALAARDEHAARLGALLGRLSEAARAGGRAEAAVTLARRRTALDPLSEEAARDLMAALADAGDRPAALGAYERLRERLARELRLAPSAATRALAEDLRSEPPSPPVVAPLPAPLRRVPKGAFVGRADALARLHGAWARASRGERPVVLVSGEAGIGKTRLVAEFCREAHAAGAVVLYGRCYEDAIPYEPFVEALGDYVAAVGAPALRSRLGPSADELARLAPDLAAESAAPAGGDPDGARFRLFDAVDALLAAAGGGRAPVLALDDLHWADRTTLALLRHLTRSAREAPLLVLLTYRLGEGMPRTAPAGLLPHLRDGEQLERATLEGLDEQDVAAVAAERYGAAVAAPLGRALHRRSEGNPFFVEELLRNLREAAGGPQDAAALAELELPEGVREVIERRLSRLGREDRRVLAIASAVGREFGADTLEALGDIGERELLDALDAAVEAELIVDVPGAPGRYSFTHALVAETLYGGMSATRRARVHAAIAAAIERRHGERSPEHLAELARHRLAAAAGGGHAAPAAHSARLAGDRALAQLAYEDAARQYELGVAALDAAGEHAPRLRAELLGGIGEARLRGGRPDRARAAFAAAAELARSIGAPDLLARAALGFGGLGVTILDVDEQTVALLEAAIEALGDRDQALRARLLGRLAVELYYGPSRERSEALSADAVELARRSGDAPALAYALNARHVALWRPDRLEERLALAREIVATAERAGDPEAELQGRNWLVTDLFEAGEPEAARDAVDAYERLARSVRLPTYEWYAPLWRSALAALAGDFAAADRDAAEAARIGALAGDRNAELLVDLGRVVIHHLRGEFEAKREIAAPWAARKIGTGSPASLSFRAGEVFDFAVLGREAEAREHLRHLTGYGLDRLPFDVNWLESVGLLGEACALLGETGPIAELYDLLRPYEDRHEAGAGRALLSWGSAARHLGVMAAALGRFDDAERHFEAALRRHAELGMRPWAAWTRLQYAEMLLARAVAGDRERAAALLGQAAAEARALGLTGLERRVEARRTPVAS